MLAVQVGACSSIKYFLYKIEQKKNEWIYIMKMNSKQIYQKQGKQMNFLHTSQYVLYDNQ